jgi:hypothetical protein
VEILRIHLARRGRDPKALAFDLPVLAEKCAGFSGAEIEHCVIEGLYEAFDRQRELTSEDVGRAIAETTPLSVTSSEDIARMRAWATTRTRSADAPTSRVLPAALSPLAPPLRPRPPAPKGPRSGGRA